MKRKHRIKIKRRADIAFFVCTCGESAFPVPGTKFTFACPIGHADLLEKRKTMSNKKLEAVIADMRETFQNTRYLILVGKLVERSFRAGIEQEKSSGDWHNLTKAIADGSSIDFEKLDGRKIRMVHEDGRDLRGYKLERVPGLEPQDASEWVLNKQIEGDIQPYTFINAWRGKGGWTLWVDGEIPMRKKTADELEPGTVFDGIWFASENFSDVIRRAVVIRTGVNKRAIMTPPAPGHTKPEDWEVVSVVGDFETLGMYGQKESE